MHALAFRHFLRMEGQPAPVREPSKTRVLTITLCALALDVALLWLAREYRNSSDAGSGLALSVLGGMVSVVFVASIGEWLTHRYVMHGCARVPLVRVAYEMHHIAHHHIHFTPGRYVRKGEINYVPMYPPQLKKMCASPTSRFLSMATQAGFYVGVATAFTFVPTWFATRNVAFSAAFVGTGLFLCFLFLRVHDWVHYPERNPLLGRRWFRYLDHHHFIHHIDTRANTNFLLPLGDLLFGTYRARLTDRERARWPSFVEARSNLIP